jgi:hypothetical protein
MHQAGSTSPMESLPGSAALYTWSGRQPGTTVSRPPPQPDWSRPIRVGAPSVLARKRRYAPVASGTRSPADSRPSAQHGTSRHSLINSLNLRVRGSSPWRRTRSDLGFLRVFDPISGGVSDRFVPLVAPRLLIGRVSVAIMPRPGPVRDRRRWSRPVALSPVLALLLGGVDGCGEVEQSLRQFVGSLHRCVVAHAVE